MTLFAILGILLCVPTTLFAFTGVLRLYGVNRAIAACAFIVTIASVLMFSRMNILRGTLFLVGAVTLLISNLLAERQRKAALNRQLNFGYQQAPDIQSTLLPRTRHETDPDLDRPRPTRRHRPDRRR